MEKMLGPSQLAEILNVRVGTIYSWICRGVSLPPFIKISGTTRWREKDIQVWMDVKTRVKRKRNFEE